MDEGLRWGEPPKIPIMERVRVATFSFGLGFAGAVISQFIFARINVCIIYSYVYLCVNIMDIKETTN